MFTTFKTRMGTRFAETALKVLSQVRCGFETDG